MNKKSRRRLTSEISLTDASELEELRQIFQRPRAVRY